MQIIKQFSGKGSGSWGTLALAAGLGKQVWVVPCGSDIVMPAWSGQWSGGQIGGVVAFEFCPAVQQFGFGL